VNAIVAEMRPFAEKYKATVPQAMIALTAHQPGITHVLVGARDAAQARENARGGTLSYSEEDLKAMNALADRLAALKGQA